jgi:hypothetical protein
LARFNTDIEGQERDRNVRLRKPRLLQGTGEAEAMQQAKGECHDPEVALGQPPLARTLLDQLAGNERDAERDRCFHGFLREAEIAESRAGQREAMRDGEGSDRLDKHPEVVNEQDEREDE